MVRISRTLSTAWLGTMMLAGIPASGHAATAVLETNSSGLLTFSSEDAAIRVAVIFAAKDDAVVPTQVRFIDAKGNVIKQQAGELRDGQPVVVELTRRDVGATPDLLVRIEVVHRLPALRIRPYPILVTTQPVSLGGSGRFLLDWDTGHCGCLPGLACGPPGGGGRHVVCLPLNLTDGP